MSRRRVLTGSGAAALAAGTASVGPLLWVPPASAAVRPGGVHLMYGKNPKHRMAVSWSTPAGVRRPRLELGLDRTYGLTVPAESRSTKDLGTVYHHVDLRRLRPGTRYHYRLSHKGASPVTGTFRTAPKVQRPFRFAAFGDMGVNAAAAAHVALIRRMRPKFAFVVGDLCYADTSGGTGVGGPQTQDFRVWDQWLNQIQPSAGHVPWMTTVGNHEMEEGNGELGYSGYLDRFQLPGNGVKGAPVTYSFVHGNVGFIALDGNDASYEISRNLDYLGSAQDQWLRRELAEMRSDPEIDFIVVGFHNCMYCTNLVHGSDGGNRSRWEPIFDRYSVDLVVNGHNHCYERTHPLRDGAPVIEAPRGAVIDSTRGTTYLTAGGAGQAVYPTGGRPISYVSIEGGVRVPETTEWSALTNEVHSVAFLDAVPRNKRGVAKLKLTALSTDGKVIDRLTLKRRR
ncbi:purple acid phosphatase family protein [Nocardioides sp.]|uniref:purple acid phosphatase family protein n=1 Tax=Nocardioides sp. TaxID=35761 RepID=UPI0035698B59